MFDFGKLPAGEQQAIRDELQRRYLAGDGEDIDLAIKRYRRTLKEHDRELEHVSKMDFEKPYRWRVAPGIALRAEKALELQKKKRNELMQELYIELLHERGHLGNAGRLARRESNAPATQNEQDLSAKFAEAIEAMKSWKSERREASPPTSSAA